MAKKMKCCKGCKIYYHIDTFEIIRPWNNFHSVKCFQKWLAKKQEEEKQKAIAKLYRESQPKRKPKLQRAKENAVKWCHAYIRHRDKDEPCISCQKPITGMPNAGHFVPGHNSFLKFHELNIHNQCVVCNLHMSGNLNEYRPNLIKKIGLPAVEWLEENKNKETKRTEADYRQIAELYKTKLKKLQETE